MNAWAPDRELEHMAKELKPVLDEDFARVAKTSAGSTGAPLRAYRHSSQLLAARRVKLLDSGTLPFVLIVARKDPVPPRVGGVEVILPAGELSAATEFAC